MRTRKRFLLLLLAAAIAAGDACAQTPVVPAMTSNTTPSGTAFASSVYPSGACGPNQAWSAFDRVGANTWFANAPTGNVGWGDGTVRTLTQYSITGWGGGCGSAIASRAPKNWTFEVNVSGVWTVVDTRTNVVFSSGTVQTFNISTPTAGTDFRLNVSANNGDTAAGGFLVVVDMQVYAGSPPPPPPVSGPPAVRTSLPLLRSAGMMTVGVTPSLPANDYQSLQDRFDYKQARDCELMANLAAADNVGWVGVVGDSNGVRADVSRMSPYAVNLSLAGDTVGGVLRRAQCYSGAIVNARAMVDFGTGTNDVASAGTSVSNAVARKTALYDQFPGPWVIVLTPPTNNAGWNTTIQAINAGVTAYASTHSQVKIVDLWAQLAPGGTQDSSKFVDGIHYSPAGLALGYQAVINAIGAY